MKTTLDIPDALFRRAKSAAAEEGFPLREFISRAVAKDLRERDNVSKPWMEFFGQLKDLHEETARINQIIEAEFEQIEPEDWR